MFQSLWGNEALATLSRLGIDRQRLDWLKMRLPLAGSAAPKPAPPVRSPRWVSPGLDRANANSNTRSFQINSPKPRLRRGGSSCRANW